ncbi:hypothetical protein [Candidatus Uabimicrobium amorphum]|uniref:hypothetical protein n=1 Tax=Uabimicrobium amorphum TaxID=2596890 RepID=UPI00125EA766|nr:hypothetical protein [Candidatus Uabimicrobium amorphum]
MILIILVMTHAQNKEVDIKVQEDRAAVVLRQTKSEFLQRIRRASTKASGDDFAKFRSGYKEVEPKREQLLKSLKEYHGKIIANATFKKVKWHQKGWYLQHGKDVFSYVWDPALWERFRAMELKHFTLFRGFRKQVAAHYAVSEDILEDWKHPGLVDVEFIAVIDGKSTYRHEVNVYDEKGLVIGKGKSEGIPVVNVRIIGLKSRYFTVWLGGTDTNKNLDLTNLPFMEHRKKVFEKQEKLQKSEESEKPAKESEELEKPVKESEESEKPAKESEELEKPVKESEESEKSAKELEELEKPTKESEESEKPVKENK